MPEATEAHVVHELVLEFLQEQSSDQNKWFSFLSRHHYGHEGNSYVCIEMQIEWLLKELSGIKSYAEIIHCLPRNQTGNRLQCKAIEVQTVSESI